jgi:RND family efflux transporter MFP subunit
MLRKLLFAVIALAGITACSTEATSDKAALLEDLKKQQAELAIQIKQLESELTESGELPPSGKQVVVEGVESGPFETYLEVQGRVDARESLDATAENMGIVRSINVKAGDKVAKGAVLAELDNDLLKRSIDEVRTQYDFAKQLFVKQENLWKQKIGSEVQYLQAKNQKESLEGRLATLQTQLNMSRITAPVAGTVDEVNIKLGQAVSPGLPAFKVVNYNNMRVVAELAESYISKVKKGDDVLLYFKDYDKESPAKISYVAKTINQMNRTFRVETDLDTRTATYNPNMIVVLRINDYAVDSAITVPINLIQRAETGMYIMVAEQKDKQWFARRQAISTGKTYGSRTEITAGLSLSSKLITVGYADLNEGQEIRF